MLSSEQRALKQEPRVASITEIRALFSVCFTPCSGSALAQFGRSWFGRDNGVATLRAFSRLGSGGAPMPSRHIGLHAPFFAPARLRKDVTFDELRTHLVSFAANRKPIETGPLHLTYTNRTLVLRPVEPRPELNWLALQCFNAFDSYADRRDVDDVRQHHLSPHQRLLLKSFGQPNLMREYQFSLTLTGALDDDQSQRLSQALRPIIAEVCAAGIRVDALSLTSCAEQLISEQPPATGPGTPTRLLGRYSLAA